MLKTCSDESSNCRKTKCSGDCSLGGATERKEGYLMGNGYQVTAFGHLVVLAMPEDYGISGFQREALPILLIHSY
jgi:hypothetical protein